MPKQDTHQLSRRTFLTGAAALSGSLLFPARHAGANHAHFHLSDAAKKAAAESSLIYISPLRSNGNESKCHAEIWFVPAGEDLLVCTPADTWRSQAVKKGLDRARVWVGDFGYWTRSGEKYKSAPSFLARASIVPPKDAAVAKCLTDMGVKYATTGWKSYGESFHKGMKDGSRVIIRYHPVSA